MGSKYPFGQREKLEPFGVGPFLALPPEEEAWYDEWRIERNRKAKEHLGIFQKDRGEEKDLPGFNEFAQYYRALGLKGEQHKVHALYKYARTGLTMPG